MVSRRTITFFAARSPTGAGTLGGATDFCSSTEPSVLIFSVSELFSELVELFCLQEFRLMKADKTVAMMNVFFITEIFE